MPSIRGWNIDFSRIDNPVEILQLPLFDPKYMWMLKYAGTFKVEVQTNRDSFSYTVDGDSLEVGFKEGNKKYPLKGTRDSDEPETSQFTGNLRGGNVDAVVEELPHVSRVHGSAGDVWMDQYYTDTPSASEPDTLFGVDGTVQGLPFERVWKISHDGKSIIGTGHIGDVPTKEVIREGPDGTLVVSEEIGDVTITKKITY